MVLIESNKNNENNVPEEMAMNENEKLDVPPPVQKLFSCEEIERSIGSQLTGKNSIKELIFLGILI